MSVDIPNYRIIEKLGVGAESSIYRARCMHTGRDYAVKIIKVRRPEDASYIDLLRAEHAIGSSIDHPVIRKVYELRIMRRRFRVRGAILFMEYVAGLPMSDKAFVRPLDDLLAAFVKVAEGLHAMHKAGYVHADLKPNNILVAAEGAVKLIDFGQSSRIHEAKPRVQGTIDYIAPEQVQRGILNQRTDVFGLGAALHRVITGKPVPTEMNQTVSVYSQSLVGKKVSEVRAARMVKLPTCLARLIDECCKTAPEERIADMPTLIERIGLARAILAKQSGQDEVLLDDATVPRVAEDSKDTRDDLDDSMAAEFGLLDDESEDGGSFDERA